MALSRAIIWWIKVKIKCKLGGDTFQCIQRCPFHWWLGPTSSLYTVAVKGLPVLCTTSLLSSQPKSVNICTLGSREASHQSKVPSSRTQQTGPQGFELTTLRSWVQRSSTELRVPLIYKVLNHFQDIPMPLDVCIVVYIYTIRCKQMHTPPAYSYLAAYRDHWKFSLIWTYRFFFNQTLQDSYKR